MMGEEFSQEISFFLMVVNLKEVFVSFLLLLWKVEVLMLLPLSHQVLVVVVATVVDHLK
jgi:hypothetical protein